MPERCVCYSRKGHKYFHTNVATGVIADIRIKLLGGLSSAGRPKQNPSVY